MAGFHVVDEPRNILVVSDTLEESEGLLRALASHGRYRVITTTTAAVRTQCNRHELDLIITGRPPSDANSENPEDYPNTIPILCIGHEPSTLTSFSGIICFTTTRSDSCGFYHLIETLGRVAELYRTNQHLHKEVLALNERLAQQQGFMEQHSALSDTGSPRDRLTGLFNRHHLNKVLGKDFSHYKSCESDLCLLILDLDYFELLNLSVGRSYGDFVLNDFAARLTQAVRPNGICFRFSGGTFVSLLPDTDLDEAIGIADSFRASLEGKPFIRGDEQRTLSISAGIVSLQKHQPGNPDEFIAMAERALFIAKIQGRNRVMVFQPLASGKDNDSKSLFLLQETLTKIIEKTKKSVIDSLLFPANRIIDAHHQCHIAKVRHYVELLGKRLNLPDQLIVTFQNTITLHASIRQLLHGEMVNKPKKFSAADRAIMDDFPYKLAEFTDLFDFFSHERIILLHHGEHYDGSGYPKGLKGEEIPLGARLFNLIDALAAMNSDRPHRVRLAPETIIAELTEGAGSRFDPHLVSHMLKIIKDHQLLDTDCEYIDSSIKAIVDPPPREEP